MYVQIYIYIYIIYCIYVCVLYNIFIKYDFVVFVESKETGTVVVGARGVVPTYPYRCVCVNGRYREYRIIFVFVRSD